ncbi:MAG: hypothetical protein KGH59_00070 [Candidatus Micrarchaeota archaeon]|nr:hypothetical protein [Candidatus Micrarchaeota archaeon]MDE1804169.1 hypothetical protein [Candidatus Micrarchaeota archaeon]MDE1846723.1 hypothetical protein [Candidatus Micrarchaeota archaeon]
MKFAQKFKEGIKQLQRFDGEDFKDAIRVFAPIVAPAVAAFASVKFGCEMSVHGYHQATSFLADRINEGDVNITSVINNLLTSHSVTLESGRKILDIIPNVIDYVNSSKECAVSCIMPNGQNLYDVLWDHGVGLMNDGAWLAVGGGLGFGVVSAVFVIHRLIERSNDPGYSIGFM